MTTSYALTSDWHRRHEASGVPGAYWDDTRHPKAWRVDDPDARTAAIILKLFPELACPELETKRAELEHRARPFNNADELGLWASRDLLANEGGRFYDFQGTDLGYVEAILERHGSAYIGWERGLGKTLAACTLMAKLELDSIAPVVLVVCPNTAKQSVWAAEIERFLPAWDVHILPNEKKKREAMLEYIAGEPYVPLVLVAHYEAMPIIAGKSKTKSGRTQVGDGWKKLGKWDLVVLDEAHRIANEKSQMARAIKKIPTKYKLALSGSIIQNHAEELYSVLNWLFPDRYKSKWRDWCDRYVEYVENGYGKIAVGIKQGRLEALRQELGVFMVYRRKEDELDLPEKTEQTLLLPLAPKQAKAYAEVREQFWTKLENGEIESASNKLAQLNLLRRLATGLDTNAEVLDSSKIDMAVDMIMDNPDEAFVVFSWYKAPLDLLAQRLEAKGVGVYVVDGDVKQEDRAEYIASFQAGSGRVFLGTLATLGESVTLHRATNAIFLDRHWNPATNAQAADRIYRIGQERPVTITHLVAQGTVDELRVLPKLADKEALRKAILGG